MGLPLTRYGRLFHLLAACLPKASAAFLKPRVDWAHDHTPAAQCQEWNAIRKSSLGDGQCLGPLIRQELGAQPQPGKCVTLLKYSGALPIDQASKDNGGWRPVRANGKWWTPSKFHLRQGCRANTPQGETQGKSCPMIINTNISAETSAMNLAGSTTMLDQSLARLSSGSKITSPADDPAGLAESIGLQSSIGRTGAASTNLINAISFSQTQDGFLSQIGGALDRMSELSIAAQDVTKSASDRADYQAEFATLQQYVTNSSGQTFNAVSLFSATQLSVTIDGDGGTFNMTAIDLSNAAYTNATANTVNITTTAGAVAALALIKAAITQLGTDRADVGANVSRMTYTNEQLGTLQTNLSAAKSQITDVDVAQESTQFARFQILVQAGTSMLAQANQIPQSVLKLLQ